MKKAIWLSTLLVVLLSSTSCGLAYFAAAAAAGGGGGGGTDPLKITTESPLADGKEQYSYGPVTIEATGGTKPYTWTLYGSSSLPSGLSISNEGVISGTPTTAGIYSFTVQAVDQDARTATRELTITVLHGVGISTEATLADGKAGMPYNVTLQVENGSGGYAWSLENGSFLPTGISLSANGELSGTPTTAGDYDFTIRVTDNDSKTDTKLFSLLIKPGLTIISDTFEDGEVGLSYHATLEAVNGQAPYSWSLSTAGLPTGTQLYGNSSIMGVPTEQGNFSFTVMVTDNASVTDTKVLTIYVDERAAVLVTGVNPSVLADGDFSQINWKCTRSGNYYLYLGGDGTLGCGTLVSSGACAAGIGVLSVVSEDDLPDNQETDLWIYVQVTGSTDVLCSSTTLYDDQTAPMSQVTNPKDLTSIGGISLITGNAADTGGAGVAKVEICIQDQTSTYYWDGSSFNSSEIVWLTAPGGESWAYDVSTMPFQDGVSYQVRSRATDSVENEESPGSGITFTVNTDLPVVTVSSVSPEVIGPGQASSVQWSCTKDAFYSVEVGGTGTNGSGTVVAAGLCNASTIVTTLVNESFITDDSVQTVYVVVIDNAANEAYGYLSLTDDHTEPTALVSFPEDSGEVSGVTNIIGTAYDNGGSTVGAVEIQVVDPYGDYFNGTDFSSNSTWLNAAGAASWSYDASGVAWENGSQYTVRARATDNAGNVQTTVTESNFTYTPDATPPTKATGPYPSNGADNVSITVSMSWTPASGADGYNVYFGPQGSMTSRGYQTGLTYEPPSDLLYDTTYTWRIDSVGSGGTTTGDLWSFHTEEPPLPSQVVNIAPYDGETGVGVTPSLHWEADNLAIQYDVYLADHAALNASDLQTSTDDNSFVCSTLQYGTTYYWRVDAVGDYGTATGEVWVFRTDDQDLTAPTCAITDPATAPLYTTNSSLTVSGTASDNVEVSSVTLKNHNSGEQVLASGDTSWSGGLSLQPGNNTITATATDSSGNNGSDTTTVYLDSSAPLIEITSPTPSDTVATTGATITLMGNASDDVGLSSVTWRVAETLANGTASGTDLWNAVSIPLSAGVNTIYVTAHDLAGRNSSDTLTVIRDNDAPFVVINSPTSADTYLTATPSVSLGGNASDMDTEVELVTWVNETTAASGNATGTATWFTGGISLACGSNTIVVTAWDAVGNSENDSITVTYDGQNPTLYITSPSSDPSYTNLITVDLAGNATDNDEIDYVTWQNVTAGTSGNCTFSTPAWNVSGVSLAAGSNTIRVRAYDKAGNSYMEEVSVVRDQSSPSLQITSPTSAAYFVSACSSGTLGGTATDDYELDYILYRNITTGSTDCISATSPWSISGTVQSGNNFIVITAYDKAGNNGSDFVMVHYDDVNPLIHIVNPSNSGYYESSVNEVNISGCASDINLDSVTWINQTTGASGEATGKYTWVIMNVGLQFGCNTIVVTAHDTVGLTNSATIIVNNTGSAPSCTITTPTSSSTYYTPDNNIDMAGTVSDSGPVDFVYWENLNTSDTGNCSFTSPDWSVAAVPLVPWAWVEKPDTANTLWDASRAIDGNDWRGQRFTIDRPGRLTKIVIRASKSGSPPNMVFNLWNGNGATLLSTQEIDASLITGTIQTIVLANAVTVTTGQELIWEFHCKNNGGVFGDHYTLYRASFDPYEEGSCVYSYDNGSNWNDDSEYDCYFRAYVEEWSPENLARHVKVTAVDCDSLTGSDTLVVKVDNREPEIWCTGASAGLTYTSSSTVTIQGCASDNFELDSVVWTNDNTSESDTATGTSNWSASGISLVQGLNIISVEAYDKAGNSRGAGTPVIYDNTRPTLTIDSPGSDPFYNNSYTVTLSGTVSDDIEMDYMYWYNDTTSASGSIGGWLGGNWTKSISGLVAGSNFLRIRATDEAGNYKDEEIEVYVDVTKPTVTITQPSSDPYYQDSTIVDLSGTASDNGSGIDHLTFYVVENGNSGDVSGTSSWMLDNHYLPEGNNTVIITAHDAAGNTENASILIIIDKTSPVITVVDPVSGGSYYTQSSSIVVSGNAVDSNPNYVRYYLSGEGQWHMANGFAAWSTECESLTPNAWVGFNIYAYDKVSKTDYALISVCWDASDPTVNITSPTASTVYTNDGTISLTGTSGDAGVGAIENVTWINALSGQSGLCNGSLSWTANLQLTSGSNLITIRAYDKSGRYADDTVTVVYDTGSPTLSFYSPSSSPYFRTYSYTATTQTYWVTASDSLSGVDEVIWYNYDDLSDCGSFTYHTTYDRYYASIPINGGYTSYRFEVTDKAGNSYTRTMKTYYKRARKQNAPPAGSGDPSFTSVAVGNYFGDARVFALAEYTPDYKEYVTHHDFDFSSSYCSNHIIASYTNSSYPKYYPRVMKAGPQGKNKQCAWSELYISSFTYRYERIRYYTGSSINTVASKGSSSPYPVNYVHDFYVQSDGNYHTVYWDEDRIYYKYKTDSPQTIYYESGLSVASITMCVDETTGDVHVAWHQGSQLKFRQRNSGSWGSVVTIPTGSGSPGEPHLTKHGSSLILSYTSQIVTNYSVYYKVNKGSWTSTSYQIAQDARHPKTYVDNHGHIMCTYIDIGNTELNFVFGEQSDWSAPYKFGKCDGHDFVFDSNYDTAFSGYYQAEDIMAYKIYEE